MKHKTCFETTQLWVSFYCQVTWRLAPKDCKASPRKEELTAVAEIPSGRPFFGAVIWVFPKIGGKPPKIINFNRVFHYFHRPFWGDFFGGFSPDFWKHQFGFCPLPGDSSRGLGNTLFGGHKKTFQKGHKELPGDWFSHDEKDLISFIFQVEIV